MPEHRDEYKPKDYYTSPCTSVYYPTPSSRHQTQERDPYLPTHLWIHARHSSQNTFQFREEENGHRQYQQYQESSSGALMREGAKPENPMLPLNPYE